VSLGRFIGTNGSAHRTWLAAGAMRNVGSSHQVRPRNRQRALNTVKPKDWPRPADVFKIVISQRKSRERPQVPYSRLNVRLVWR